MTIRLTENDSTGEIISAATDGSDEMSYVAISDEATLIFRWINHAVICQIISVFGVVSNIINIICFVKHGFNDSVNVSLLGLAISDLGCLVTMLWLNLNLTPAFLQADLPFDTIDVSYLTGGWPHNAFARVTCWITALITLERCLCITMPIKVKSMVTPSRAAVIVAVIFILLMCSVSPVFCVNGFAMKFYPEVNKTLLGLTSTEDREIVEKLSIPINNVFIPSAAFVTVLISTIVLVYELRKKAAWRKTVTADTCSAVLSNRDQKVAKMIVMISVLFIACFVPVVICFLPMIVEPEFGIYGKYRSIFMLLFGFCFTLESINSSMNIFIYYHMSSKYKAVFRRMFCIDTGKELSVIYSLRFLS